MSFTELCTGEVDKERFALCGALCVLDRPVSALPSGNAVLGLQTPPLNCREKRGAMTVAVESRLRLLTGLIVATEARGSLNRRSSLSIGLNDAKPAELLRGLGLLADESNSST